MRDIVITAIVMGSLPLILSRPWVGIMMWIWIGYMNPHRMSYGFAYDLPFAQMIALVTILGWLASKESKSVPWNFLTALVVILIAWCSFTMLFRLAPDEYPMIQYQKTLKIMLMTFIGMSLINNKNRLIYMIWAIAISLGFFGFKGGIFTVLNGGESHVWGPPGSFIEDNNQLAVALVMLVPLLRFLQMEARPQWLRLGLLGGQFCTAMAVLGTQSRGGMLGLAAMLLVFWYRSKKKLLIGVIGSVVVVAGLSVMPAKWFSRMETIDTYEEDQSAMQRIHQWIFAVNLANSRIVGGGFGVFANQDIYDQYNDDGATARASHSVFFQVIGEQGWIGFAIFMVIIGVSMTNLNSVRKKSRDRPELGWAFNLASMMQATIVGYCVAGATVNLAFFDFYWHIVSMVIILDMLVRKAIAKETATDAKDAPEPEVVAAGMGPVPAHGSFRRRKDFAAGRLGGFSNRLKEKKT